MRDEAKLHQTTFRRPGFAPTLSRIRNVVDGSTTMALLKKAQPQFRLPHVLVGQLVRFRFRRLFRCPPTIDHEGRARGERRSVGREKDCRAQDILHLAQPA